MSEKLHIGIKGICNAVVGEKDTANAHGSGLIDVFATPAMVALMEKAAHTSVQEFLAQNEVSVGSELQIKHIKATGPGKKVWAESLLTKIEGKKLYYEVSAFDEAGLIGKGHHIRYIVDVENFMSKV